MNKVLEQSKTFLQRNSSTILTVAGAGGVIATSVLAVKATPKAMRLLEEAKEQKGDDLTTIEVVRIAGPPYIPAVIMGASTLACIFGANALNKRSQASLMSAYAMLDNSYKKYKNKVEELYGEDGRKEVEAGIAVDKYKEEEIKLPVAEEEELFYDFYSDRYFVSTKRKVLEAEYLVNRKISTQDYAYLNDFYEALGLDILDHGYTLGWSMGSNFDMYWQNWVDFEHEPVTIDEGLDCTIISIRQLPIVGFEEYC